MKVVCRAPECPNHANPDRPMRMVRELAEGWFFECPVCCNERIVHKSVLGGTMGQGFTGKLTNRVGYTA